MIALAQTPLAAAGTAAVVASPAFGGELAVSFSAVGGETNIVTIRDVSSGGGVEITDTGATISVGPGCVLLTPQQARCSWPTSGYIDVDLGDQNDSVSLLNWPELAISRGGDGDDIILGASTYGEELVGGSGNDTLRGRWGYDFLDGGPGADTLSGGSSGDCHANACWEHEDTVTYASRMNGVRVDRDGVADDGEPGEGDRILRDVERIEGGFGNDILIGRFRQDVFSGGAGDDFLLGNGGLDFLHAGIGDDTVRGGLHRDFIRGGRGHDVLWGGRYADLISGGGENDRIVGGFGRDELEGNGGDDFFLTRDGWRDTVFGALGRDTARVDVRDRVRGVERLLP